MNKKEFWRRHKWHTLFLTLTCGALSVGIAGMFFPKHKKFELSKGRILVHTANSSTDSSLNVVSNEQLMESVEERYEFETDQELKEGTRYTITIHQHDTTTGAQTLEKEITLKLGDVPTTVSLHDTPVSVTLSKSGRNNVVTFVKAPVHNYIVEQGSTGTGSGGSSGPSTIGENGEISIGTVDPDQGIVPDSTLNVSDPEHVHTQENWGSNPLPAWPTDGISYVQILNYAIPDSATNPCDTNMTDYLQVDFKHFENLNIHNKLGYRPYVFEGCGSNPDQHSSVDPGVNQWHKITYGGILNALINVRANKTAGADSHYRWDVSLAFDYKLTGPDNQRLISMSTYNLGTKITRSTGTNQTETRQYIQNDLDISTLTVDEVHEE